MSTFRGQHLIGRELGSCTLEKLLGYGGSSAVFLAQQHTPERKVAVKVFLPRSNMDIQMQRSFYTRFLHEAEAASELDHPAILPIYAYGEQDGWPYIVMPYMPGGTLGEYIEKNGPLSLEEAQYYFEQLAPALDYAHAHGFVHCDVKPANILLDEECHVLLSDFGIARLTQQDSANKQNLRQSGDALMGTPQYISPEQALAQHLDGRSDIYSLGITLFYLLAGSTPFEADNAIAIALLHVHEPPPLLSNFREDCSPAIDYVMNKALSKWPEDRFQTAGEFSAAFAQAISNPESIEAEFADEQSDPPSDSRHTPQRLRARSAPTASVHIRPVRQHNLNLPRTLFTIILVMAVLGTIITASLIIWLANTHYGTKAPSPTPTATPAFQDILADNEIGWPHITGQMFFTQNGQYHILNNSGSLSEGAQALYETSQYSDFRLTVTMSEVQNSQEGGDYYGVVFRSTDKTGFYLFEVSAVDGDQFGFYRADYKNGKFVYQQSPIAIGDAPSLLPNLRQNNVLTIVAKGNGFIFLINGKPVVINGKPAVNPISDPSQHALTSGQVGLFVDDPGTEVVFSKMHISPL